MSAITGIGDSTTIVLSASMSFSRGTATRTTSAPASATRRIWSIVACRLAVSVLVMVCTTTGAPPPIWTPPTVTERWEAIGLQSRAAGVDSSYGPLMPKHSVAKLLPSKGLSGYELPTLAHRHRRDPGRDHVRARHDDRQRRPRHALQGPQHVAGRHPVGRHGLHARARRGDPRHGLGGHALRRPPALRRLADPLHARLGPLRLRL